jgi:hypothetical protein
MLSLFSSSVKLYYPLLGDLVATEILCGLWENYGPKHRLVTRPSSASPSAHSGKKIRDSFRAPEPMAMQDFSQRIEVV